MLLVGENLTIEEIKACALEVGATVISSSPQGNKSFKIKLGVDPEHQFPQTMEFLVRVFETGHLTYAKTGFGNFYHLEQVKSSTIPLNKMCNGWSNYETWTVHMFLTSTTENREHNLRDMLVRTFNEAAPTDFLSKKQAASALLADRLKNMLTLEYEQKAEKPCSDIWQILYWPLLQSAFDKVDWYELASSYIEDWITDNVRKG